MADIYIPGVSSRFNTTQIIEDLMSLERIPRDRVAQNIENLQLQKDYWREVGNRITSLRDSARFLYSFQNPFNDRIAKSSNEGVITASATRTAGEQSYSFTVKQIAQADRFLSAPLDEKMRVEAGIYNFSVGKDEISINFSGGTLQEFVNTINSRGNGKIAANLIAVQSGTKSLLIESKVTGEENRLVFSGDSVELLTNIGMMEQTVDIGNMNANENTVGIINSSSADGDLKPLNPVSTARDAVITMEGIEIRRSANTIDDLIPGVTLNVKGISERSVDLSIATDTEGVKDAIISFVGNYNRLIAEINVLTARSLPSGLRTSIDDTIINELTYLTADERADMRSRLGAFNNDSTLNNIKNSLMRAVSAPYPTYMERDLSLFAQIGISTNAERSNGYDPSRLRGYLQIDEKILDAALENRIPAIKELFASDTTGDLLMDTGIAYNVETLMSPFVGTGGIISLKTNTIDSRITQDERQIATLDRQLAAKETELKIQYARMESAYDRMEKMSNSLNIFSQQNSNNR